MRAGCVHGGRLAAVAEGIYVKNVITAFSYRVACLWLLPRWLILMWVCGCSMAHALQVTDDRGQTVTFTRTPQRIVSLLPSLTESVCGLGQCQRLVGVDRYSNYPARVQGLPKVGGGLDPSIEMVVALKPDLVLVSGNSRAVERLEALGLKVVSLETKTHSDVRRVLKVLGALLEAPDTPGAEKLWRDIDTAVAAAAQSVPERARNISVFFEVSGGQYGAGETSFIGETLARLGLKNVVSAGLGPFPKLSPEFIVRSNPDVIMTSSASMSAMSVFPGWASLKAVKTNRVCVFSSEESDILVRPGPRLADAAGLMAKCLQSRIK
jgi:iron complex transport system substrate-binding protein